METAGRSPRGEDRGAESTGVETAVVSGSRWVVVGGIAGWVKMKLWMLGWWLLLVVGSVGWRRLMRW
ncbi:hypothetical protein HDA39_001476 [Kribbella italica]|uniref:Uncharacterized protein n=1 Tax=Kribbella italica TaxID=1540520 RepID=A0A7W9J329_9ACTN|nr:hypothetical protein [Kribbella italica]